MIELIVALERQPALGAHSRPVALADLFDAYRRAYPSIGTNAMRAHFETIVQAHCVNRRARFPDASNPHQAAAWLSRPLFKGVAVPATCCSLRRS